MSEAPNPNYLQRIARDVRKQSADARTKANNARKRQLKNSRAIPMEVSPTPTTVAPRATTVSYIGGKKELILDRNIISLLSANKLINAKTATILYVMMEYGADEVSSGITIFEQEGEFAKFCLAYDLDIEEAYRHIVSFKSCRQALETKALQLHFDLAFPGE